MSRRFVARWPDGSESRAAWLLWMAGALVFSLFLLQCVVFVDAVMGIVEKSVESTGGVAWIVATLILQAAIIAAVLGATGRFAARRLLMPRETWLVVASVVAALVAFALFSALQGQYVFAFPAGALAIGAVSGWMIARRGQGLRGVDADGEPSSDASA